MTRQWGASSARFEQRKVLEQMAELISHARGAGLAAVGAVLMLSTGMAGTALAQQAKQPAAAAPAQQQSAWVKLCEKAPYTKSGPDGKPQLDKDNKPVLEEKQLCLTHHEQMTNTGITMVSAAIQQLEGIDKLHMMVMVPPTTGIVMPAGMSVVVYNKEQVEKLEKKEQLDEKTLVGQKLMFTICHQNGCTAENEATPQLVEAMKKGVVMVAYATHVSGQPIPYQVPLVGFTPTFDGKPVDNKAYQDQRSKLQETFMANRLEQMKQIQAAPQQAPGAPAAGGAPAAKAPAAAPAAAPAKK
jgi:invasion protein IalB